jgi:hypothetical protein
MADWVPQDQLLDHIDRHDQSGSGYDAKRLLVVAARGGFEVFGRRAPGRDIERIPAEDWGDDHCLVDGTSDGRRLPGIHFRTGWCDLMAKPSDVEARWPSPPKRWVKVYYGEKPLAQSIKQHEVDKVADYIGEHYPNGPPPGGWKEVYRRAGTALSIVVNEKMGWRARNRTR